MWILLGKPVRRWLVLSLAVPLVAGALAALGRFVQHRKGRPTTVSESLFAISSFLRRRTLSREDRPKSIDR